MEKLQFFINDCLPWFRMIYFYRSFRKENTDQILLEI